MFRLKIFKQSLKSSVITPSRNNMTPWSGQPYLTDIMPRHLNYKLSKLLGQCDTVEIFTTQQKQMFLSETCQSHAKGDSAMQCNMTK